MMKNSSLKTLRIACLTSHVSSTPQSAVERIVSEYRRKYPDVIIDEQLYELRELRQALFNGQVDIIFAAEFLVENIKNISRKRVATENVYLAISDQHPLSKKPDLQIDDLNNEVFYFVSSDNNPMSNIAMERCRQIGISPREIRYLPNFPSVLMAVKQGAGVATSGHDSNVTSGLGIMDYKIEHFNKVPYMVVAWRKDDLPEPGKRFVRMIQDT